MTASMRMRLPIPGTETGSVSRKEGRRFDKPVLDGIRLLPKDEDWGVWCKDENEDEDEVN